MKKQFRILAAALALCLSLLCCPAAFAAVDSSSCQTVPYAQATSQPLGQPITITGTPNYSAATSNDTAFIFGFDTADGVWYVAVQKSKFDAFKAAAPAQQMTLYGVYAGTLDVNGMPILDIQNGSAPPATRQLCTRPGRKSWMPRRPPLPPAAKRPRPLPAARALPAAKRARAVHLPARRPARWCGSPPMAARSTTATPTAAE